MIGQTLLTTVQVRHLHIAHPFGDADVKAYTLHVDGEVVNAIAGTTYHGKTFSASARTERQAMENVRTLLVLELGGADNVKSAWALINK